MKRDSIRVWRIVSEASLTSFPSNLPTNERPWTGEGASLKPQRWNVQEHPVAYAAASRALAAWEVLVHQVSLAQLLTPRVVVSARIGPKLLTSEFTHEMSEEDLLAAPGWDTREARESGVATPSRQLGHRLLIDAGKLVLRVPSVVIRGEFNYVINVKHPAFSELTFSWPEPFEFDNRILALIKSAS